MDAILIRIRFFLFFLLFLLPFNNLFAQSEIIELKTKAAKPFSLWIIQISTDSIFYKHEEKVESIALTDVIAYRQYDGREAYIFPNRGDKEKYEIKNKVVVEKKVKVKAQKVTARKDRLVEMLKEYKVPYEEMSYATLKHSMLLTNKDNGRVEKASPKRSFFLILKKDERETELKVKPFKIIDDSILYVRVDIDKGDKRMYAIPLSEIRFIKLEPQRTFAARMVVGVLSCGLVVFPPSVFIPVYLFSHPFVNTYDLKYTWKLKLKV
jgi:hypothetical protein